jgi:hypothetical protein
MLTYNHPPSTSISHRKPSSLSSSTFSSKNHQRQQPQQQQSPHQHPYIKRNTREDGISQLLPKHKLTSKNKEFIRSLGFKVR